MTPGLGAHEQRVTATSPDAGLSPAERTRAARVGAWMFRRRGVLPIPVLAAAIGVRCNMSVVTWSTGLTILACGELLRLSGVAVAGPATRRRTRAVGRLVTAGPFAWTRNPIYLGNGMMWTGVAVITGVPWLAAVGVAVFALEYGFIVRYEEGVLESTFGSSYLAYKRATPRWLPQRPAPRPRATDRRVNWRAALRAEATTMGHCGVAIAVLALKGILAR